MQNILRTVLLFALTILSSSTILQAQEQVIKGTVTDESGETLPGASVVVKGTRTGVITNENGQFVLTAPAGTKELVVSFLGLSTQEIQIGNRSVINVTLRANPETLNEVVVIGYGSVRRADVTSAISSLNTREIKDMPVAGIDQAIQGKIAGVTVNTNGGQPGGGVSVKIRGISSVNGFDPLYVVDGVMMQGSANSTSMNVLGGGGGQIGQSVLSTINPNDIESVDILKDAAAQAIYGSRGAYGVVLITTKRGKSGIGKISYETFYGQSQIPKKLDIMNLREYAGYTNSLVNEVRAAGGGMDSVAEFRNPSVLGHGTDWQDQIYQTGLVASHQLAFSGGHEKTTYRFSGGYFDQQGTLIETSFKRYSVRANLDHQVKDWFKAGFTANLSRSNQKIGLSNGFDAVTSLVLYNSPAAPVRELSGDYSQSTLVGGVDLGNGVNPVTLAQERDVRSISSKAFGQIYGTIDFIKGLQLHNELNYNFTLNSNKAFQPFIKNSITNQEILGPSTLREERMNSLFYGLTNYFSYNRAFGKHAVNATAGHEMTKSSWDNIIGTRFNLTNNLPSLKAGSTANQEIDANADVHTLESYFVRGGYTFNNKYSISGTLRRDGSTNFGPEKRWGTFTGISGSWTASQEAFLKDSKYINYLKLRLSAGSVGHQEVRDARGYQANITPQQNPFGGSDPSGLPANVPNPKIAWEAVRSYNGGVDISTWNKRLDLTLDVYNKKTTNMILYAQLGEFAGIGTAWNDIKVPQTNDGQITNKGFDFSLTSHNIQKKNFAWKSSLVLSKYTNTLDRLNNPQAAIKGVFDEYGPTYLITLSQQGLPVGSFYGYVTDGLFRSEAELNNGIKYGLEVGQDKLWLGDVRYKDLNNDNVIDERDVTVIGNPTPDFTFGFTNSATIKQFDLTLFLQGSKGGDIFNYSRRRTEGMTNPYANQTTNVLQRYSASNPNGDLPRFNNVHNNNLRVSDRWIEDGSYLRIQNVTLGYNVPRSLASRVKLASARFYISGQNLYTFTKYSGYDPDLGALNNDIRFMNVDNGNYPNPRTFTLGANLEF